MSLDEWPQALLNDNPQLAGQGTWYVDNGTEVVFFSTEEQADEYAGQLQRKIVRHRRTECGNPRCRLAFAHSGPCDTQTNDHLENRYYVERIGGTPRKHDNCSYFVLDPQHDPFAHAAIRAYADACESTLPKLANELRKIVADSSPEAS